VAEAGERVVSLVGPLEPERLAWVAGLYGRVDRKYADLDFLRHLFGRGPAGPALHAFALDDGRPIGHCAVVPIRGRRGNDVLRTGKVEALFLEEAYRGPRGGGTALVVRLREQLYRLADDHGIEVLHAYVRPEVGRALALDPIQVGEPALVAVTRPLALAGARPRAAATALAAAQTLLRAPLHVWPRRGAVARAPRDADVDLVASSPPSSDRWTVLAEDAWDWYCASPALQVLELDTCRGLVQLPGSPGDPLRLVGWSARPQSLPAALRLLRAAIGLARRTGAGTVRFQPWPSTVGNGELRRACRLLGFVARRDFTTLYVRASDETLARSEAVVPTPLLYLSF
jgi:hypothetical protein